MLLWWGAHVWGAGVGAQASSAAGLESLAGTAGRDLSMVRHLCQSVSQSQDGAELGSSLLAVMPKYSWDKSRTIAAKGEGDRHPFYRSCCHNLDVLKLMAVCVCVFKQLLVQPFSTVHFWGYVVRESANKVSLSKCTVPASRTLLWFPML